MPASAASSPLPHTIRPFDRAAFTEALGDIPWSAEATVLRRKSRDYFWFSPILKAELDGRLGDLIVSPRDEADVVRIASLCARFRVPLVTRGAGTGNYGQSVPLHGGVVMETIGLDRICWIGNGRMRAQAGCKIVAVEDAARAQGLELHMHPSTKRIATIGGYFAGGSGGIGSVTWGGLREPGNLLGARVVTVEEEPRIIELRDGDTGLVNRTFGATGIIVEVELPLAPALPWRDCVATFPDLTSAVACGYEAARDPAIEKRLLTPLAASIADHLNATSPIIPQGRDLLAAMISTASLDAFETLVRGHGGELVYDRNSAEVEADAHSMPIYEFSFGHTTLQALKSDRSITYLQCLFPAGQVMEKLRMVVDTFGDELPMHIEFIRFEGEVVASAVPLVRFSSAARIAEIIATLEGFGIPVANPHVSTVEDGSRYKRVPGDQMAFKAKVDPFGLLNPGKMRSYVAAR
jgi:hypothetical protein